MLVLELGNNLPACEAVRFNKILGRTFLPREFGELKNRLIKSATKSGADILAANEVGIFKQMIYVKKGVLGNVEDLIITNPTVTKSEGIVASMEACKLKSEDNLDGDVCTVKVHRPCKITVSYISDSGKDSTLDLEGERAILFLQRYHLLSGVTPLDLSENILPKSRDGDNVSCKKTSNDCAMEGNSLKIKYFIAGMGKGCCVGSLIDQIKQIPGVVECSHSIMNSSITVNICDTMWFHGGNVEKIGRTSPIVQITNLIANYCDEGEKYTIRTAKLTVKSGLVGTQEVDLISDGGRRNRDSEDEKGLSDGGKSNEFVIAAGNCVGISYGPRGLGRH